MVPPWMSRWTEQGSPPAVAGGRVYVTTNAGLICCLAADSGQPIWSYQYEVANRPRPYARPMPASETGAFPYPPNPIILTEGLVICLPADSEQVVALASESGEPVWDTDRLKQHDLTALGGQRLLLSGGNLIVLRTRDGTTAFAQRDVDEIVGRPAISADSVIASGRGRLFRLDLKTYTVSRTPVFDEVGLLGRLVGAEGRLVAANAAGVCVYFAYQDAWKVLGRMLEAAGRSTTDRFKVRLKRGQFAMLAGELAQAREEFQAAEAQADAVTDQNLKGVLRMWRHRLAVHCAELATDDTAAGRFLQEAGSLTSGPASEAELLLRQMRYHEKFGHFPEAAQMAQTLAEKFAETPVHDVAVAPAAGAPAWPNDDDPTAEGYVLGQREVARIIATHGKEAYAAFDALAAKALQTADPDALIAAQTRYPHSAWADRLLLAAAEGLYRSAAAGPPTGRKALARAAPHWARSGTTPTRPWPSRPGSAKPWSTRASARGRPLGSTGTSGGKTPRPPPTSPTSTGRSRRCANSWRPRPGQPPRKRRRSLNTWPSRSGRSTGSRARNSPSFGGATESPPASGRGSSFSTARRSCASTRGETRTTTPRSGRPSRTTADRARPPPT